MDDTPLRLTLREETPADHVAIRAIHIAAFGQAEEADLVDALRRAGAVLVSLAAEVDGGLVGHILFSRMFVESVPAVALAPVAVHPSWQRRGIGGELIRRGLDMLRDRREEIVIVLGHPDYYPRFGFSRDMAKAIEHPFPPEAFMALELRPGALAVVNGKVRYADAFGLTFSTHVEGAAAPVAG